MNNDHEKLLKALLWDASILDCSSIGHFIINEDLAVLFWNKSLESWSKINREQILGSILTRHFPHLENPKYLERIKSIFKGGPPYVFSSQLHKYIIPCPLPGDKKRIQQTIVSRLPTNDPKKFYAFFSVQDETNLSSIIDENKKTMQLLAKEIEDRIKAQKEKENLESQLRHAQKMEAIGTLAGGIAHDFNNILAAIIGFSDMAMEEIPEENPAHQMIGRVLHAGNRAKKIVKHILAVSRHDDQNPSPVLVSAIVKEVLALVRVTISKNVTIAQNIDNECGSIMADSSQIHQVIMNLCENAAFWMEEKGGTLNLSLNCVCLDEEGLSALPGAFGKKPGQYVELVVEDSGPGIREDVFESIFDPYFTTKPFGKGSGMGLAIVNGIVKKHQGFIEVRTKVGEGTSFHIYFPVVSSEQADIDPAPEKPE